MSKTLSEQWVGFPEATETTETTPILIDVKNEPILINVEEHLCELFLFFIIFLLLTFGKK